MCNVCVCVCVLCFVWHLDLVVLLLYLHVYTCICIKTPGRQSTTRSQGSNFWRNISCLGRDLNPQPSALHIQSCDCFRRASCISHNAAYYNVRFTYKSHTVLMVCTCTCVCTAQNSEEREKWVQALESCIRRLIRPPIQVITPPSYMVTWPVHPNWEGHYSLITPPNVKVFTLWYHS